VLDAVTVHETQTVLTGRHSRAVGRFEIIRQT